MGNGLSSSRHHANHNSASPSPLHRPRRGKRVRRKRDRTPAAAPPDANGPSRNDVPSRPSRDHGATDLSNHDLRARVSGGGMLGRLRPYSPVGSEPSHRVAPNMQTGGHSSTTNPYGPPRPSSLPPSPQPPTRNENARLSRDHQRDWDATAQQQHQQQHIDPRQRGAHSAAAQRHSVPARSSLERQRHRQSPAPAPPSGHGPTSPTAGHPPHYPSSDTSVNSSSVNHSSSPVRYGRPEKLGVERKDFINVLRKDYTGRIELLQGSVEGLSKADETDLLIVYLRERGVYKANRDSSLAALNRSGISLAALEKESKPQPSYRRHYHCWLSRPIPRPRPLGFEYKRLLVYEDPGEELTRDDNIILDIVKCLTTVIGGDVQIQSVLIPLSGALLSPSLRKHFVKAAVEVSFAWMRMGLPLRTVKILLPETDISKDIETFRKTRDSLMRTAIAPPLRPATTNDVYFSYAQADKDSARDMISYMTAKNPAIQIYEAESRDISVRKRGVVDNSIMEAVSASRIFLALLSDDYFHSVECTEAFSLAYCRDFESQGNFIIPLFWRSCDLTPLARRLVATEGVDCREASFKSATTLLDEILSALTAMSPRGEDNVPDNPDELFEGVGAGSGIGGHDDRRLRIAEKLLMKKDGNENELFEELAEQPDPEETVSQMFFDRKWRENWAIDFKEIVFGPRIGAGGFGEVYKCKYDYKMVAVKTLQKIEDDDPQALMAEFMVEMKLMSKLRHPNIVEFIGACIHNPNLAIILEFMAGGSLYRAIHRRRRNMLGPFPLLKTVWIAFGVAKGMAHLHSQYPVVIHRDVKSPNVLLGTNVREVKITDFGLSRLRVNSYVNTGPGGTPEWMAPELLRQDPFNEKSDVFSFGVILWELVMCEKPWRDDHPMQIVFKVGSRGEKLPTPPPESCEPELREMIVECFADDPKRRPDFKRIVERLDVMCHRVDS